MTNHIPTHADTDDSFSCANTPAPVRCANTAANEDSRWPYSAGSQLIDRDLARSIREWALTEMTEAELNAKSQRQLLNLYIERYMRPTLAKLHRQMNDPEHMRQSAQRAEEIYAEVKKARDAGGWEAEQQKLFDLLCAELPDVKKR